MVTLLRLRRENDLVKRRHFSLEVEEISKIIMKSKGNRRKQVVEKL